MSLFALRPATSNPKRESLKTKTGLLSLFHSSFSCSDGVINIDGWARQWHQEGGGGENVVQEDGEGDSDKGDFFYLDRERDDPDRARTTAIRAKEVECTRLI